jgi:hypothetical protein
MNILPENFQLIPLVVVLSAVVHHVYMSLSVSPTHLPEMLLICYKSPLCRNICTQACFHS